MSLCEGILQSIEDNARLEGYSRVTLVRLEIGVLAGVELEAMRFGFDAVMKGSLVEGATLDIIEVPAAAWCMQCGGAVRVQQRYDACPDCEGYQLQVTDGEQMRIKELLVD